MIKSMFVLTLALVGFVFHANADQRPSFDIASDLLVFQYDSKTDADDIHSIAATGSVLKRIGYEDFNYIAVAGAYGRQPGLYIPSPELFDMVFPNNWVDAHNQRINAINAVYSKAKQTLNAQGQVWVMEAGQSDVSAQWLSLLQDDFTPAQLKQQVHIVQHSDWNEKMTTPMALEFVKRYANYHRIEDGNYTNNSTAGFYEVNQQFFDEIQADPTHGESWTLALQIASHYNGLQGRYRNPIIAKPAGIDFSDVAELIWILELDEIKDVDDFAIWLGLRGQ